MYKCAFCSDQLVVRSVSDNDRKVISLLKEPLFVHLKSGGDQLCYICAVTLSNLYIVLNKKLQDSPFSRPSMDIDDVVVSNNDVPDVPAAAASQSTGSTGPPRRNRLLATSTSSSLADDPVTAAQQEGRKKLPVWRKGCDLRIIEHNLELYIKPGGVLTLLHCYTCKAFVPVSPFSL